VAVVPATNLLIGETGSSGKKKGKGKRCQNPLPPTAAFGAHSCAPAISVGVQYENGLNEGDEKGERELPHTGMDDPLQVKGAESVAKEKSAFSCGWNFVKNPQHLLRKACAKPARVESKE
jgi:hypothetical protein